MNATSSMSARASPIGLPQSRTSSSASSWRRSRTRSAMLEQQRGRGRVRTPRSPMCRRRRRDGRRPRRDRRRRRRRAATRRSRRRWPGRASRSGRRCGHRPTGRRRTSVGRQPWRNGNGHPPFAGITDGVRHHPLGPRTGVSVTVAPWLTPYRCTSTAVVDARAATASTRSTRPRAP